jgi:hypothetical protein
LVQTSVPTVVLFDSPATPAEESALMPVTLRVDDPHQLAFSERLFSGRKYTIPRLKNFIIFYMVYILKQGFFITKAPRQSAK